MKSPTIRYPKLKVLYPKSHPKSLYKNMPYIRVTMMLPRNNHDLLLLMSEISEKLTKAVPV